MRAAHSDHLVDLFFSTTVFTICNDKNSLHEYKCNILGNCNPLIIQLCLHFQSKPYSIFRILQPFIVSWTTHNLTDSCQAHLPVHFASNIEFIRQNVTLVLWLTGSHTWVACAKQASCLLHWLSVFTLAVRLFRFALQQNSLYDYMLNTKLFYLLNYN